MGIAHSPAAAPARDAPALPGEALTRRAVTAITLAIVVMTFAFSLGNVTRLCLGLGITAWIAWLVGPAVDLTVVGLLTGMRFLSLHGYDDAQLARPRRMLWAAGALTLALNTAGAVWHRQFGTALVDAVGPALLIGWCEVGPWMLRQIHAVCPAAAGQTAADAAPCEDARPAEAPSAALRPVKAGGRSRTGPDATAVAGHFSDLIEAGRLPTQAQIRAHWHIGSDKARALLEAVAEQSGLPLAA